MGIWAAQFFALLQKNYLLKRRSMRTTLMEIFYPLYFLLIIGLFSWTISTDSLPMVSEFPAIPAVPFSILCTSSRGSLVQRCNIAYAPNNSPLVDRTMERLREPLVHLMSFDTSEAIQDYYQTHPGEIWAAIVWGDPSTSRESAPSATRDTYQVEEEISQFTIQMNQTKLLQKSNSQMISSGFLSLQTAVQQAVINQQLEDLGMNRTISLNVATKLFPQHPQNLIDQVFSALWGLMIPMAFSFLMQGIISSIVTEKSEKLKEGMKMMGLKETVYWASWLVTQSLINVLMTTLFVAVGYLFSIFSHTPIPISFITFFLYGTSIVSISFFCSVFFSNAKTGTSVSMMVFYAQIIASSILQYFLFHRTELWAILLIYLLSSVMPPLSLTQLSIYFADAKVTGHTLSLGTAGLPYYPVWLALAFQVINILLYGFLTWYVSNILPGEYGTGKYPWFIISPSYWRPQMHVDEDEGDQEELLSLERSLDDNVEISLRGLTKIYQKGIFRKEKDNIVAVDDLSLDIFQGEILALLGHNGAGKSTTIGMLTGLFPPSSGDALIRGHSVRWNMDEIRRSIGVCPQHDILFEQLTAVEHLELYAALKGVSRASVTDCVAEILSQVGLDVEEHAHKPTKGFSGGMKRKLSVAIALIGDSKVIFLDECTAGMDPLSRREIWQLLQRVKENRTIILTTHFMEEADILGDRIAIMSKGGLKVIGSSVELKSAFGVGYYFVFVKEEKCDPQRLTKFVEHHFKGQEKLVSDKHSEISFQIPLACTPTFASFFEALDEQLESLQIHSYGIYTTTLEEVFLRIAEEEDSTEQNSPIIDSLLE